MFPYTIFSIEKIKYTMYNLQILRFHISGRDENIVTTQYSHELYSVFRYERILR